jgi:hypothetical protein
LRQNIPHYSNNAIVYILYSLALLLSLYLANRYLQQPAPEAVTQPDITTVPVTDQPAPSSSPKPEQLDLSIDRDFEFDAPPGTFGLTTDEIELQPQNDLFDVLNKNTESPFAVSGKLMLKQDEKDYLKAVEGLQLEVEIQTE